MRRAKFKEGYVVLTEKQYEGLLRRFDPKKVTKEGEIDVPCNLCDQFDLKCTKCPFHLLPPDDSERGDTGQCYTALQRRVGNLSPIKLDNGTVSWLSGKTEQARKKVTQIRKALIKSFVRFK